MPTSESRGATDARQQAGQTLGEAVEQARTPLLAALGAGDLAAQTIADTVSKLRARLSESAESARSGELPNDLRARFDPAELRKQLDAYTQSAAEFYNYLADRGETAFERFQSQPQVQRAWSQVEQAQGRVETAVGDVRGLADDVLGKVTTATRSFGEKAAQNTEKAASTTATTVRETADDVAETVEESGSEAATATRSTARKTANRTANATSSPTSTGKTTSAAKSEGPTKSEGTAKTNGASRPGAKQSKSGKGDN